MKKLLTVATSILVVAFAIVSYTSCTAQTAPKANLKTEADSLAYATGINYTQGLDQYLMQLGINEENRADLIKGLLEGANIDKDNKKESARITGLQIGRQIAEQMIPSINQNLYGSDSTKSIDKTQFLAGFIAGALKKDMLMDEATANMYATTTSEKMKSGLNEKMKAENLAFLEENKKKDGVVVLPSGLQYKVVKEGDGAKPTAEDVVEVDYVGTTIHGKEFDSSVSRGQTAEFPLNQVIAGWTEGIQLMPVGSKYMFYIPYDLAYGEMGRPGAIDPFATLIFEVDLHKIVKEEPAQK